MSLPTTSILARFSALAALGAIALILSSCQSTPTSVVDWTIAGTSWNVVELEGQMVPLEKIPTLQLETGDTRVVGFGGVNRYGGTYQLDGDHLTFSTMTTTRMAGTPQQMQVEAQFFQVLASVTSFRIRGPWLSLMAGDKVVARAQGLPAQPLPKK